MIMLHPWCHPYCLSISRGRDAIRWRRPGLLHCGKGRKTTFCRLLYCVGTAHLFLLAAVQLRYCMLCSWLSSVSRSRRRSEKGFPFRTSTLFRIAVGAHSHTLFVRRGSVYVIVVCIKHTS